MKFSRGLAALTLVLSFLTSLHAEFLYKDDVVNNPKFTQQIESIGSELKAKTGISLYLVMLRDLDSNESITDFEKRISAETNGSAVIMTFVELKKEVDILARPTSLYNDFNKGQVLSPNATFIGAVVSSIMFARSYDEVKELISNRGGTILPILAERAKGAEIVSKYSVAMYNGYADVAEQIAASKGQTLSSSAGTGSQTFIDILRLIFYGIILYALFIYVRGRFFKKRETKSE
ncbi:MAG: 3-dehydroquinate dehydratase [Sulfuricurvum sp.]|nr:3-dehydroquinate dehydratase [Sulfuricurvum sp.]